MTNGTPDKEGRAAVTASSPERAALTIAGFDPSGGAGVLADVRTFSEFGLRASAVVTSITFQDANHVYGATHQTIETLRSQVTALAGSCSFACTKTGMLPTREIVIEVARFFRETALPGPVVDPVLVSSSGFELMEKSAIPSLVEKLFPLVRLITPNIPEAERLTGLQILSEDDMRLAAAKLREMGARAVLVKGGHLGSRNAEGGRQEAEGRKQEAGDDQAVDLLDDEGVVTVFREELIPNTKLHGSGCMLSAAIAAGLGTGNSLKESIRRAKQHVLEQIRAKAGASASSRP